MKKKHHVLFCAGLSACLVYEFVRTTSVMHALSAVAVDGLELAILFYGLVWTTGQIYDECCSKKQPASVTVRRELNAGSG
jgi:hypothetical protein